MQLMLNSLKVPPFKFVSTLNATESVQSDEVLGALPFENSNSNYAMSSILSLVIMG